MATESTSNNPNDAKGATPITKDASILAGQPFVRGTRLSVEFLQGMAATGWSRVAILDVYPYLTGPELEAALAYTDS